MIARLVARLPLTAAAGSLIWITLSTGIFAQTQVYDSTAATPTKVNGTAYEEHLQETVDPSSGALSIRILAPTPKDRGVSLPLYAFIYDSAGSMTLSPHFHLVTGQYTSSGSWTLDTLNLGPATQGPSTGNAWLNPQNTVVPSFGQVTSKVVVLPVSGPPGGGSGAPPVCTYATAFLYTDPAGSKHPLHFNYVPTSPYSNCGKSGMAQTTGQVTSGDEMYTAVLTPRSPYTVSSFTVSVYDNHGNQMNANSGIEDTNGNYPNGTGRPYSLTTDSGTGTVTLQTPATTGTYSITHPTATLQQLRR